MFSFVHYINKASLALTLFIRGIPEANQSWPTSFVLIFYGDYKADNWVLYGWYYQSFGDVKLIHGPNLFNSPQLLFT